MEISQQVFSGIQNIFQLAGDNTELPSFTNQILRFLFNQIYAESAVVHFASETKYSKGDIEFNLDWAYVQQYKDYYYKHDPVHWIDEFTAYSVVSVEDFIDYQQFMDSAFYNDFLVPQRIHHKLYLNLYSGFNHHARIGLYRNSKYQRFSNQEIYLLKMIVPYLGHAIEHHKLMVKNRLQNIFFDILDENSSKGIMLLDASLRLIHLNRAAKEYCRILNFDEFDGKVTGHIPDGLIEDCRSLDYQSLPLTLHRTFSIDGDLEIEASSRILLKEITSEKKKFFLIYLEEKKLQRQSLETQMIIQYHLTKRECEIVRYLFEGLRNADIAKKVFLSEISVKKHVQSIFKKLKVLNRASAVRKIAETYQTSS